jgi:hypothetical protein
MGLIDEITWRPGIGDPNWMGWLTVAAYAAAAVAARSAAVRSRADGERWDYPVWMVVAALMLFLCVNKQLDLQSLFTNVGRVLARRQGWYWNRHEVLGWAVYLLVSAALVVTTVLAVVLPRFWKRHALLALGLVFLCVFIAVRALSLHSFDAVINATWYGVRVNWVLELAGITAVGVAAARASRRKGRER